MKEKNNCTRFNIRRSELGKLTETTNRRTVRLLHQQTNKLSAVTNVSNFADAVMNGAEITFPQLFFSE